MNTGRNLTFASAGIIFYVLSGADFQSAGVGGISWDIKYPAVIKLGAVIFWLWLVVLHWLSRKDGEYYQVWIGNAVHYQRGSVKAESVERSRNAVEDDLKKVAQYFEIEVTDQLGPAATFGHVFLHHNLRPGVYVAQSVSTNTIRSPGLGQVLTDVPQWKMPPISPRQGFFKLLWMYPDVVLRTFLNNPEVLSRRVLPWIIAVSTFWVMLAEYHFDVSSMIGPWTEQLFSDTSSE